MTNLIPDNSSTMWTRSNNVCRLCPWCCRNTGRGQLRVVCIVEKHTLLSGDTLRLGALKLRVLVNNKVKH